MALSKYLKENGILTGFFTDEETIILPEDIEEVGEGVFAENETLKKVIVPAGVLRIGKGAFSECRELEEIEIADGLEEIGESAFEDCENLRLVALPKSVSKIGKSAFSGCSKLQTITIPSNVSEIGEMAFSGCSELANSDGFTVIHGVLYDYSGEDSVYDDHIEEWDYRNGVIRTQWMGDIIVDKNGNIRRDDRYYSTFYKTDKPRPEPIDPSTLSTPEGDINADISAEDEQLFEEREEIIESTEDAAEEAAPEGENDVQT